MIPVENGALSPIAERVLRVRSLTHEFSHDGIVIAVQAELMVRTGRTEARQARNALQQVAEPRWKPRRRCKSGPTKLRCLTRNLARGRERTAGRCRITSPSRGGPLSQLEIWRLKEPETRNSIDESRRLRAAGRRTSASRPLAAMTWSCPPISLNHAPILCPTAGGCPAAPPKPASQPERAFVQPPTGGPAAKVTILDSGYIWVTDARHASESRRRG